MAGIPSAVFAYGGIPATNGMTPAALTQTPQGGVPAYGSVTPWEGEPVFCAYEKKSTGLPCGNEVVPGTDHCFGHARAAARLQTKDA